MFLLANQKFFSKGITMKVKIVSGDISKVKADALMTAINSGGAWFGGIDGVIQGCAGGLFHGQASAAAPLKHGQTIVAMCDGGKSHKGRFTNVVFIVDDLKGKLNEIIFNGLVAAADANFASVSLPTIRMGVMLGVVEKSKEEAVGEMVKGINRFLKAKPDSSIKELTFVVYNDPEILGIAQRLLTAT